jgi:exonuclease III
LTRLNTSTANLTIASWNTNGVRSGQGGEVDVMAVSETKLTPTDKLRLKDYTTYRLDRPDAVNAGGVALLIHKNVPHAKIKTKIDTSVEVIGVRLVDGTHVFAAYNRPSNRLAWRDLRNIFETASRVIVTGDFNCKHPSCNCNRSNPNGTLLKDFADDQDLLIHNTDEPTHYPVNGMTPTTIDLMITKNVNYLTKPISLPELESDHNPVVATIKNQFKEDRVPNAIKISKINWVSFRRTLDKNIKINHNIPDKNVLDREVIRFTESVDKRCCKKHAQNNYR